MSTITSKGGVLEAGSLCIKQSFTDRQLFVPDIDMSINSISLTCAEIVFMRPFSDVEPTGYTFSEPSIKRVTHQGIKFYNASDEDLRYIFKNWPSEGILVTKPSIPNWLHKIFDETQITKAEFRRLKNIAEEYI
jgi:hypothetical protein